jgi:hypothetical protein
MVVPIMQSYDHGYNASVPLRVVDHDLGSAGARPAVWPGTIRGMQDTEQRAPPRLDQVLVPLDGRGQWRGVGRRTLPGTENFDWRFHGQVAPFSV